MSESMKTSGSVASRAWFSGQWICDNENRFLWWHAA